MKPTLLLLVPVIVMAALQSSETKTQNPQFIENVYYVCNGERVAAKCSVDDKSDSAYCSVSYPDRPLRNGFTVTQPTTRGELRKLFATCQAPGPQAVQQLQEYNQAVEASQRRALAEHKQYVEMMKARMNGDTTDPGTLAGRRCLASGRGVKECLAEVIGQSVPGLIPVLAQRKPTPGLRLSGVYEGSGSTFTFPNSTEKLPEGLVNVPCGNPLSLSSGYFVRNAGNAITLTLTTTPNVEFELQADGSWKGPGQVTITGYKIVGYGPPHAVTTQVFDGFESVPTFASPTETDPHPPAYTLKPKYRDETSTVRSPITAPTPVSCNFGIILFKEPASDKTTISTSFGFQEIPSGLRMVGEYKGSGGLTINFHPESATTACGETEWTDKYSVVSTGKGVLIELQNGQNPFAMLLRPDGSLIPAKPASVTITGRVWAGSRNGEPIYSAARPTTCQLVNLSPVQ